MVSFLLRSSFFGKIRPLAQLEAMAYTSTSARSNRRHDDTEIKRPSIQWHINPSLQILGLFDKGIRQESTKRVKPFIVCCADCSEPLSCGRLDSEKGMRVYTSFRPYGMPRMACWQVFRQNSQKSECVLRRCSDGRHKQNSVLRHPPTRTG